MHRGRNKRFLKIEFIFLLASISSDSAVSEPSDTSFVDDLTTSAVEVSETVYEIRISRASRMARLDSLNHRLLIWCHSQDPPALPPGAVAKDAELFRLAQSLALKNIGAELLDPSQRSVVFPPREFQI